MIRLLNVDSLEFVEFHRDPPLYAVTSHRWYEGEEVTIRDMMERREQIQDRKGFQKILGFCLALKQMLKLSPRCTPISWLWMDTCCIDKANFTELSEAITSMFKWYSRSRICLAYLHDVGDLDQPPSLVMDLFQRSEWYCRGWTLQELLAPQNVVFYNKHWEVIGHKSSNAGTAFSMRAVGTPLNHWISKRTKISEEVLADFSQADLVSVEDKQSWMQRRSTTRPEDKAYCQLGIFGVFMPLIYGEEDHAMVRLSEAIEQKARRGQQWSSTSKVKESSGVIGTWGPLTASPGSSYYESLSTSTEPWNHNASTLKYDPYRQIVKPIPVMSTSEIGLNNAKDLRSSSITSTTYPPKGGDDHTALLPALSSLSLTDSKSQDTDPKPARSSSS